MEWSSFLEGEKFRDSFTVRTLGFGSLSFFFFFFRFSIRGKSSRLDGWMEYETRCMEDDRRRKLKKKKKSFDFLENIIFVSLSSRRIKNFYPIFDLFFPLLVSKIHLVHEKNEIATLFALVSLY